MLRVSKALLVEQSNDYLKRRLQAITTLGEKMNERHDEYFS